MQKDKYEISIWEDYIVEESGAKGEENYIPEHYEEQKIAIIGSDSMTSQIRAVEPRLVNDVNGTNTLTFKLYYTYIDNETGEKRKNPFLNLLVNERKIKCYWKNNWYDFVIKNIQEDSGGKSITYTCKDLFVNELSKTGFSIEFNNELDNNQGTVQELAEKVLEGTDWFLGEEQDVIQQTIDEALYEVISQSSFTGKRSDRTTSITIPVNTRFFVFYSVVQDEKTMCQFIYEPDGYEGKTDKNSQLLVNVDCSFVDNIIWTERNGEKIASLNGETIFTIEKDKNVSSRYRGSRLVRSPIQEYDSLLERYCYLYKDINGKEIYKYITTEYNDPTVVLNLINNAKDFSNTNGWIGNSLAWSLYPPFDAQSSLDYHAVSYFKVLNGAKIFNTGLQNSSMYIEDGFQKGEKYIFRVKGVSGTDSPTETELTITNAPYCRICDYTESNSLKIPVTSINNDYFSFGVPVQNGEWIERTAICNRSIPRNKITTEKMGLFLIGNADVWVEEVQFFKFVIGQKTDTDSQGNKTIISVRINPGEMDIESVAREVYCYYYKGQTGINKDSIEYLYKSTEDWSDNSSPIAIYNDSYEKIRSIEAKNSNRFNLLQTLAETFECWVRFKIEHDSTGRVVYVNGIPQKRVYFKKEVGQESGVGFIYGIDLKTIQRTIASDQITSKVIVVPNTNQYAENGVCEIAQSSFNESKENFILDFGYYINQGLLTQGQINKDLYLSTDDSIGYYYWLKQWNNEYYQLTEQLVAKKTELLKQKSLLTSSTEQITSLQEEISSLKQQLAQLAGLSSYSSKILEYLKNNKNNEKVNTLYINLKVQEANLESLQNETKKLEQSVKNLQDFVDDVDKQQEELRTKINNKHEEFYNKYSRFIQEGSWSSQDYLDENLYYLDAKSVAYTSSRPQISYTISVLRLSALPEYAGKIFNVGDITYIQDTDFFGYTIIENNRTPYKEKALISEVTSYFDSPQNDNFKVQNYKTQFEDLFQRITSTTQSLQYASGEYARAASAVESNGTINRETLQNSILVNEELIYSSQNETIYKDSTGITLTDSTDSSYKTKITSRGIFISVDGGVTWKNAVRGEGLSTQYLTAGAINSENITILQGSYPSFRWDSHGLNAYRQIFDNKELVGIQLQEFVRFDHYGIYGMKNQTANSQFIPTSEEDVWSNASFGLTWKGFFLRNLYGENGSIEISSEKDIVVNDGTYDRVKIGKLSGTGSIDDPYIFGLQLKNQNGNVTLTTESGGDLWLKDRLSIGNQSTQYKVGIGALEKKSEQHGYEVINANDNFLVYEDGTVKANNGEFTGIINATGGTIGGLDVSGIVNASIVSIVSTGTGFINNSPEQIVLTAIFDGNSTDLSYTWYRDDILLDKENNEKLIITSISLGDSNYANYSVKIRDNSTKKDYISKKVLITNDSVSASGYFVKIDDNEVLKFYIDKEDLNSFDLSVDNIDFFIADLNNDKISFYNEDGAILENEIKIYASTGALQQNDLFDALYSLDYLTYNTSTNNFSLNILKLKEAKAQFAEISNPTENQSLIAALSDAIENESAFKINIEFYKNGKNYASDSIIFRIAQSTDSAKLNIFGNAISQVLGNKEVIFDGNGLTVKNGKFFIVNEDNENVFYADQEGNLCLKGKVEATSGSFTGTINATSGTFTGEVNATSGNFNGTINALGGSIGGFSIYENSIVSSDGKLKLFGKNGRIEANSILLGENAEIDNYIKLRQAYICNPEKNEGIFLKIEDKQNPDFNIIQLTDDGILKLNKITIDGQTSTIKGVNWSISPTLGQFENIVAKGGTIENVVFKNQSSQFVGGQMMFKPSSKVLSAELIADENNEQKIKLELEDIQLFKAKDFVYICGIETSLVNGIIEKVENSSVIVSVEDFNIFSSVVDESLNITSIIKLASLKEDSQGIAMGLEDSLLIGINSNDVSYNSNELAQDNGLYRSGITFIEPNLENNNGTYSLNYKNKLPNLFIGNLEFIPSYDENSDFEMTGFGLYGENVYLKGSLVTQVSENKYAGMNTTDSYLLDENKTDEKVVIWAGASGRSTIGAAPFRVTERGSLYAEKGVFNGAVISRSILSGTDIYAARLHGGTLGNSDTDIQRSELGIYSTSNGIVFRDAATFIRNENEIIEGNEVFRISNSGFSRPVDNEDSYFISINSSSIDFNGNNFVGGNFISDKVRLTSSGLYKYEGNMAKSSLVFSGDELTKYSFDFNFRAGNDNKLVTSISDSEVYFTQSQVNVRENFYLGDKNKQFIEYKKDSAGYDIYVHSGERE